LFTAIFDTFYRDLFLTLLISSSASYTNQFRIRNQAKDVMRASG